MVFKCLHCGETATVTNQNEATSFTIQHIHGRKLATGNSKVEPWFAVVN